MLLSATQSVVSSDDRNVSENAESIVFVFPMQECRKLERTTNRQRWLR